jgi:hypothetical protein
VPKETGAPTSHSPVDRKRAPPVAVPTPPLSAETAILIDRVTAEYVHRLFPEFRMPAFVSCPDDTCAQALLAAITGAANAKGVDTEVIDLRPAPAERLGGVTERLCDIPGRPAGEERPPRRLLALVGFDLLEGKENEAPTYPFRSKFQFDRDYVWLFVGLDWQRLRRLFGTYRLPLYSAASDLTPEPWRQVLPVQTRRRRTRA